LFVLLTTGVAVSLARGGAKPENATTRVTKQSPCAKRLLADWADWPIDGTYPIACYRVARRSLPADLQVYSSASEDIAQALSQRIVQSAEERSTRTGVRRPAG
jgi:hypothetical protein